MRVCQVGFYPSITGLSLQTLSTLFSYLQFIKSTLDGNTRLQKINDPTDPLQTVWKIIEKLCVKNSLLTLHDVPFSEIPFRECPRP